MNIKFERHHEPLAPLHLFLRRFGAYLAVSAGMVIGSLGIGIAGYRYFEAMSWTDSFLNAAMILGGMGPTNVLQTEEGKIFAGCYALYAGLVFLTSSGLILLPVLHRLLHHFHVKSDKGPT